MKWPPSQHHRVIVLCAVSMALTHLPLGREKKICIPPPHPVWQRDCQIWTE